MHGVFAEKRTVISNYFKENFGELTVELEGERTDGMTAGYRITRSLQSIYLNLVAGEGKGLVY